MSGFDSAYRWLLFQVGNVVLTQDQLLLTEESKWEGWINSRWHYSDPQTLLDAFQCLKTENHIAEVDGRIRLTELGMTAWEQAFSPTWSKAYRVVGDEGFDRIEAATIDTCVRVFFEWCFLEFVKLDSIFVTQLDGFNPLYWKRISPAFSLQFSVEQTPTSVRSPIALLATDYAKKVIKPLHHPLLHSVRGLERKIVEWHASARDIFKWHNCPEDE